MITRSFQPSFTSGELSPALSARIDLNKYDSGAQLLRNVLVHPSGGISKAPGTIFIARAGGANGTGGGRVRLIPFIFNAAQHYLLEFSAGLVRVVTADGVVVNSGGNPVTVTTTYSVSDILALSYVQSADVLYLAHPSHPPRKLMRYGHADWRLGTLTFSPAIAAPAGLSGSFSVTEAPAGGGSKIWRYKVTAIDRDTGEESLPAGPVAISGTESMRVGVAKSDGTAYPDWFSKISWSTSSAANEYRVYKEKGGGMYGYIGSAREGWFEDKNIAPNIEETPPDANNPFENGNYPSCVALHQQRLVFAGSNRSPNTIWMSRSGNFENFSRSIRVKDDDYIEATLAARRVDPIVWLVALRELIAGSTGGEWEIGGGQKGAVTPGSINAKLQSARGSASGLQPVVIGNTILHVSRAGDCVRDLVYDFGADSYAGTDRSLLATHLFTGRRIVSWDYQQSPDSIVWCVTSDGVLLGLTWMREHEIFAWHRHDTDGFYEDICVLPGDGYDDVFFVVRRRINGETVRYIEQFAEPMPVPRDYESLDDSGKAGVLAEAFHVHCGLSYRGAPTGEISGLEHLEGKDLAILADGAVIPPRQVVNGAVSLEHPAAVIHAGLPYSAEARTMNYEPQQPDGTSVGLRKRIARVLVKFANSSAVDIGINNRVVEVKWRTDEPYGSPPRLHSETVPVSVPGAWSRDSSVWITSDTPTPFTVLGVVPEVASRE